jgi:uncharacterized protein
LFGPKKEVSILTTMAGITKFLDQKTLAIVGVSRSEKKFSNRLYKVLKSKGYQIFGVNPNTDSIDGESCFSNIQSLPQQVNGVVIVVPPNQTEKVVKDAVAAGINHIWIQQGAESPGAIDFCKKNGINVIHNHCILMFAEPSLPHKCHRYVWKALGKLPK